jgi:septum formation protein
MSILANHIYLASRSLRRRELLRQIGISVEVLLLRDNPSRGVDVNEEPLVNELPGEYVIRIARLKAEEGWRQMLKRKLRAYPLLAADTTVALGNEIIGKPRDRDHASEILQRLSGTQHQVFSAICVYNADRLESRLSISTVTFRNMETAEIKRYVETAEGMDKAGAYAIQGRGAVFIQQLQGSYSGVMGLPLFEAAELLRKIGLNVP